MLRAFQNTLLTSCLLMSFGSAYAVTATESVICYFLLVFCEEIAQELIIVYFCHNRFVLNTLLIFLSRVTDGFSLSLTVLLQSLQFCRY